MTANWIWCACQFARENDEEERWNVPRIAAGRLGPRDEEWPRSWLTTPQGFRKGSCFSRAVTRGHWKMTSLSASIYGSFMRGCISFIRTLSISNTSMLFLHCIYVAKNRKTQRSVFKSWKRKHNLMIRSVFKMSPSESEAITLSININDYKEINFQLAYGQEEETSWLAVPKIKRCNSFRLFECSPQLASELLLPLPPPSLPEILLSEASHQ